MHHTFRFTWHGLDFAIRAQYTHNAGGAIELHTHTVLEARWLDDGTYIDREQLEFVLRFVADQFPVSVERALSHQLEETETLK